MYDAKRDIIFDCESDCDVYALRLSGSFPTDTIQTNINRILDQKDEFIKVYPNPSKDQFHVEFKDKSYFTKATLINLNGNMVLDKYEIIGNKITFNVSFLPSGNYLVNIFLNDKNNTKIIQIIN